MSEWRVNYRRGDYNTHLNSPRASSRGSEVSSHPILPLPSGYSARAARPSQPLEPWRVSSLVELSVSITLI